MSLDMPILDTQRLTIRPFHMDDLPVIHAISNAGFGEIPIDERCEWLDWSIRNVTALARLGQPPYGDRAIVLRSSGVVIGSAGLVPCLGSFGMLPFFRERMAEPASGLFTPEVGLFWALAEDQRGQGYATEAATALIRYAFDQLNLSRIVATTEYTNTASIAVMQRLGMSIERNPHSEPAWFQIIGVLANPRGKSEVSG